MIIREYRIPIPDLRPFDTFEICRKVCVKYGGRYSGRSGGAASKKTRKGYNRYNYQAGYIFHTRRSVTRAEQELAPLIEKIRILRDSRLKR